MLRLPRFPANLTIYPTPPLILVDLRPAPAAAILHLLSLHQPRSKTASSRGRSFLFGILATHLLLQ